MSFSIFKQIEGFVVQSQNKYHRFNSWNHNYKFFNSLKRKEQITNSDIDLAALNLGYYLASWGMYRGSAFLLQNDYKIHINAVKLLFKKSNSLIWNKEWFLQTDISLEQQLNGINNFCNELKEHYSTYSRNTKGSSKMIKKWDTLPSKILLGTTGIIPAYDEYCKLGLQYENIIMSFGHNSLKQVRDYYMRNMDKFEEVSKKLKVKYPPMKLLDIYFWMIGKKIDLRKKNKKINSQ